MATAKTEDTGQPCSEDSVADNEVQADYTAEETNAKEVKTA